MPWIQKERNSFLMRTRIAIGVVLALGVATAMPVLAGAQISDSGSAAQVQYPDLPTKETEETLEEPAPAPRATVAAPAPEPAVDDDLPVTGFVAIPLVITGVVLLLAGGVMHVRTRGRD